MDFIYLFEFFYFSIWMHNSNNVFKSYLGYSIWLCYSLKYGLAYLNLFNFRHFFHPCGFFLSIYVSINVFICLFISMWDLKMVCKGKTVQKDIFTERLSSLPQILPTTVLSISYRLSVLLFSRLLSFHFLLLKNVDTYVFSLFFLFSYIKISIL